MPPPGEPGSVVGQADSPPSPAALWRIIWEIDDSEISLGFFEPANETKEYGVQFIWMF